MFHRFKLVTVGAALLAVPGVAQGQTAVGQIDIGTTVIGACGLGTPTSTVIDLQDLTGPDGELDPAKTGNSVLGTTTIPDAWCNGPHSIAFESTAMTLQRAVPYAQPSYMARRVTFDAKLVGWGPITVTSRPRNDNDRTTIGFSQAMAAPGAGLLMEVSNLETLSLANTETPGLMLEHGNYLGTVTITLAAN